MGVLLCWTSHKDLMYSDTKVREWVGKSQSWRFVATRSIIG